jgi:hypothetical protein
MAERLSVADYENDIIQGPLHRYRYEFAAQYTVDEDTVVDAACGCGIGREYFGGRWIGVDKEPPVIFEVGAQTLHRNLNTWHPEFAFDVFVGLETIEHLDDLTAYVAAAKCARHLIILSTPIIPTKHFNPWHLHDFTRESIEELFVNDEWEVVDYEPQFDPQMGQDTYGIWAFRRQGPD